MEAPYSESFHIRFTVIFVHNALSYLLCSKEVDLRILLYVEEKFAMSSARCDSQQFKLWASMWKSKDFVSCLLHKLWCFVGYIKAILWFMLIAE